MLSAQSHRLSWPSGVELLTKHRQPCWGRKITCLFKPHYLTVWLLVARSISACYFPLTALKVHGEAIGTSESWPALDPDHVSLSEVPKSTQTPWSARTLSLAYGCIYGYDLWQQKDIEHNQQREMVHGPRLAETGTSFQGSGPSGITQDTLNSPSHGL